MDIVLFKTMHGSHLYGLNHAESDQDFYTVVSREKRGARKKYAKQNITDGIDTMTVDLSTFMHFCEEGIPQALEAMFAPTQFVEVDTIEALRRGYRVNTAKATTTYRRTIRSFAEGDFKRRRHAVRLFFNMVELQAFGRFNPHMLEWQVRFATGMAGKTDEEYFDWLDSVLAHDYGGKDEQTHHHAGNPR